MQYNVAQLMKSEVGDLRQDHLHEEINNLDNSITPLSPLDGDIKLVRTNEGIFVEADLHTSLQLECSRCLDLFGKAVRIRIDEEFLPTIDILSGSRLALDEEADPANLIDARHELNVAELVRQSLLLTLPVAPLCRSNCKGLCPVCGKNRNREKCHHESDEIDPRLARLKELLDK